MWKELVVSIPMGRDIFEFKKIFVGLWDAQSGGKVYLHIYFEASSVRSYQCEWKWLRYGFGMGSTLPDFEKIFFPFYFSDWTTFRTADCLC